MPEMRRRARNKQPVSSDEDRPANMTATTEHQEQAALMVHCGLLTARWPELSLIHAIPNGGARSKAAAGKLKAEGVKPGVPDLFLPVPRGEWAGLYLELKRQRGGRLSTEQVWWAEELRRQGFRVECCPGRERAMETLQAYLALPRIHPPPESPPPARLPGKPRLARSARAWVPRVALDAPAFAAQTGGSALPCTCPSKTPPKGARGKKPARKKSASKTTSSTKKGAPPAWSK